MPHEHATTKASNAGAGAMRDGRPLGQRLSRSSLWEADDQVGTLNYITRAPVAVAAGLMKQGKRIDLGLSVGVAGIGVVLGGLSKPIHMMWMVQPEFCTRSDRVIYFGREHFHAAPVGHSMGRAWARGLRRSLVQRVPATETSFRFRNAFLSRHHTCAAGSTGGEQRLL
jgi:hypothetical protein